MDMWRSVKTTHSRGASKAGAIEGAGIFSISLDRLEAAAAMVQYCRDNSRRRDVLLCSKAALPRIDGMIVGNAVQGGLCRLKNGPLPLQGIITHACTMAGLTSKTQY